MRSWRRGAKCCAGWRREACFVRGGGFFLIKILGDGVEVAVAARAGDGLGGDRLVANQVLVGGADGDGGGRHRGAGGTGGRVLGRPRGGIGSRGCLGRRGGGVGGDRLGI